MLKDRWPSLLRAALHASERILHPWRRRSALRRLRRAPRPRHLLIVCHANICRSPYAAAAARRLVPGLSVTVTSAGFVGPDRASPPDAVAVAAERGIDLSAHRAQLLELAHLRTADLVLVMDRQQRRRLLSGRPGLRQRVELLGDLDPERITRRTVADPFRQPTEAFRSCYDRIDRCVGALADLWGAAAGEHAEGERGELEQRGRRQTDRPGDDHRPR